MKILKNFLLLLFVILFTACGGGGGDSTPTETQTQSISGFVVDNYIKNATVCIDTDKDNSCDDEQSSYITNTDENGSFEFTVEVPKDSIIIAYGGEDAITSVSFNHLIKNIVTNTDSNDKLILSSINTLITEVYNESNSTLANAITLVNNFLGGVSQNIEETNIIEDIIANKSTQSDEFLRSLKLFQMVEQGANSIDYAVSIEIFNQLAKFIINNTSTTHESTDINITINSVIKNLYVQDTYPVFLLKPSAEVEVGERYALDLNNSAVSPDGKSVSYELINNTDIFEIIDDTKIYFKTAPSTTEDYIITVEANNSVKTNDINLSISVVNDAPVLQVISNQIIDEDNSLLLEINASDLQTSTLNYSASSSDSNVSIAWNENNLTLTPTANWYGSVTIQVVVDDGDKNDTQSFILTINPINDAPTISGTASVSVNQDSLYSFAPSANDVDGDQLYFIIVNKPSWSEFNTTTGVLSGTPNNSDVGNYSDINIAVSDNTVVASLPLFNIIVNNINDEPTITGTPSTSVNQDSLYSFTPSANDVDGDQLYFTIVNKPSWAEFNTTTGVLSGTPNNSDVGNYSDINISVNDTLLNSSLTLFSITVNDVNDAPSSSNKSFTFGEDTNQTFVLNDFNFSDIDSGDSLEQIYITTLPSVGVLQLNDTNVSLNQAISSSDIQYLKYVPVLNGNGTPYATFDFVVNDGEANSTSSTITLNVTALNDAPSSSDKSFTFDEDTNQTFVLNDFNFSDIDSGDSLEQIYITTLPSVGVLQLNDTNVSLNQAISSSDIQYLKYVPVLNGNGTPYATFDFVVNDGEANSSSQTITLSVTPVNDAPTITGTPSTSVNQDSLYSFTPSANDVDGDQLYFTIVNKPSWAEFNTTTGVLSGTPNNSDVGNYSDINISVNDTLLNSSLTLFSITVNDVNDAPSSSDNSFTFDEDTNQTFVLNDFNFSDIDSGDSLEQIYITTLPSVGVLQLNNTNVSLNQAISSSDIQYLKYVPVLNGNGTPYATFDFVVNDGEANSTSQTITLNVTALNDAPILDFNTSQSVNEDENLTITIIVNDVDDENISLSAISNESNISISWNENNLTLTPSPDWHGVADINVSANDGHIIVYKVITLTVNSMPDAPKIVTSDYGEFLEDVLSTTGYLENSNVDGNDLTFTIENSPSFTFIDINETSGALTIQAQDEFVGENIITVRATDTEGSYSDKNISLTIVNVNDKPVTTTSLLQRRIEYGSDNQVYSFSIDDADDSESQIVSISISSDNTDVATIVSNTSSITNGGVINFTVDPNEPGIATMTLELSDNGGTLSGGENHNTYTFEIFVRSNGNKIYEDQKSSSYINTNVTFDGISYTWNDTKKWYETSTTVLLPIKITDSNLVNNLFALSNSNKNDIGHYYVNKSEYLSDYLNNSGAYDTDDTFYKADGTGGIKASDDNFQHDLTNFLFVSRVIDDGDINDMNAVSGVYLAQSYTGWSTYCLKYGLGWTIPSAVQIGGSTGTNFVPAYMGQYDGSYLGGFKTTIFTSTNDATNPGKKIVLETGTLTKDDAYATADLNLRCVYNN